MRAGTFLHRAKAGSAFDAQCMQPRPRIDGPATRMDGHRLDPTNLTNLARSNHGKYPDARIVSVLEFGTALPAHGSAEMPVWGPILGKMNMTNPQEKQLRISNLSRYIESIQAK